MDHGDHLFDWLVRFGLFVVLAFGLRAVGRTLRQQNELRGDEARADDGDEVEHHTLRHEQNELRLVRDEEQAELFARELPPKPKVVVQSTPRIACRECAELTPTDELDEVDRLCAACVARSAKSTQTYRE